MHFVLEKEKNMPMLFDALYSVVTMFSDFQVRFPMTSKKYGIFAPNFTTLSQKNMSQLLVLKSCLKNWKG